MPSECSVSSCHEQAGARGLCPWHDYRRVQINNVTGYIASYLNYGLTESDSRVMNCRRRLAQYEDEMTQPKPTATHREGRRSKPTVQYRQKPASSLKGTVRVAVDLFLQSPSIETATDAKLAIDRYLSSQTVKVTKG